MLSIRARNVNRALPLALMHLHSEGVQQACRSNIGGSSTIEYPGPVATTYTHPRERVLWCPVRDANPFFHFFESLWILAGRDDVRFLDQFNRKLREVSDDGERYHGAYGYRLRNYGPDQITRVLHVLRDEPDSRRAVLQIWNSYIDLDATSKDLPCNDMVFLKARDGALNITVCCRSNDVVWGAYGANVVQFSMLQEYIAAHLGVRVGQYTQISDSFHVYESNAYWQAYKEAQAPNYWPSFIDMYQRHDGDYAPYDMFAEPEQFDQDLHAFFSTFDDGDAVTYRDYLTRAFRDVVVPMYRAHKAYRAGEVDAACSALLNCAPCDWRSACTAWLMRRIAAKAAAA